MATSQDPLRVGVLGAARIARLFVEGVRPSEKIRVTAVASRDADRAAAFARDTGVARVHASYELLLADPGIILERIRVGLPDQFARNIRMIEPLGDAVHHRGLEGVVMQDRRIDEAGKLRLAPRHVLGLVANACPDRLDLGPS